MSDNILRTKETIKTRFATIPNNFWSNSVLADGQNSLLSS